jgi:hypothetical protein
MAKAMETKLAATKIRHLFKIPLSILGDLA